MWLIGIIKVLFGCLGNICRSPLAEAIFDAKVKESKLPSSFKSDSAGTSDFHIGELPDERTIFTGKKHNLDIKHRGRQINRADFRDVDYILAMDQNNLRDLNTHQGRLDIRHPQLKRIREYDPQPGNLSVPDPYYGGDAGFEEVFQILKRSCEAMLNQMIADHGL